MVEILEIIALGGLFLTFFGFLTKIYFNQGKLQERVAHLEGLPRPPDLTDLRDKVIKLEACYENIHGLDNKVEALETKMDLFWGALEEKIPSLLLRGNPIPLDSPLGMLLQKLKSGSIADNERLKLISLLEAVANDDEYDLGEKMAFHLLSAALISALCSDLKSRGEREGCSDRSA